MRDYEKVGLVTLGESTDVTDPCYNRNVWCRRTVKTVPGTYSCHVRRYDDRIAELVVVLEGEEPDHWTSIGTIGVDSGLAGFFNNKPDFTNQEWSELCRKIDASPDQNVILNAVPNSIFTEAGYGDGGYELFAVKRPDNTFSALKLLFIDVEAEEQMRQNYELERYDYLCFLFSVMLRKDREQRRIERFVYEKAGINSMLASYLSLDVYDEINADDEVPDLNGLKNCVVKYYNAVKSEKGEEYAEELLKSADLTDVTLIGLGIDLSKTNENKEEEK